MAIRYVIGDATAPEGEGPKVIVHVCNDIGGWGRGFVVALSKRWDKPELVVLQRGKLGESVLAKCDDTLVNDTATQCCTLTRRGWDLNEFGPS